MKDDSKMFQDCFKLPMWKWFSPFQQSRDQT